MVYLKDVCLKRRCVLLEVEMRSCGDGHLDRQQLGNSEMQENSMEMNEYQCHLPK